MRAKAYPKYKDSGVEWLGQIPAHWEAKRLKDAGMLMAGSGFPHEYQGVQGEVLQFYKVGDLVASSDGIRMHGGLNSVSRETAAELRASVIPAGSLLWAKIGAALFLNRRRITTRPCCIDNNLTAFVPNCDRISTNWAFYWTSTLDFGELANPGAVPSLSEGYQSTLPLVVPPESEQKAIAGFLDRETAKIDALVEKKERLIELLQEKRTALITHAVTKGLDPNVPMKDSRIEWLGQIPAHWDVRKWRYCCRITEGQVPPDDERYRDRVLIAPNHVESGTGKITLLETADEQGAISGKYLVSPGDIIYSKIRPALNKACIASGDWLCSADMYPVRIIDRNLKQRFLLYFILSEAFVRLMVDESMRVAMPKVNREKLSAAPVLIPGEDEQNAIVRHLDRETAKIDALIAKIAEAIERLKEYRTALISAAVTGKIDVRGVVLEGEG